MPRNKRVQVITRQERLIKHVAAYIRVSTDEQAQSGLGLDAQQTKCKAFCTVKDWPYPDFYADEGISGTKDHTKRPELARLIKDIKSGDIDVVIVPDLSRLGRNTRMVLDLVDEFTRQGVALVSCKESWDTGTPQGQFVLTVFAALTQLERDLTAERTRVALAERAKIDGERGGRLPYGYKRSPDGLIVDPISARAINEIFQMRSRKESLRKIAETVSEYAKAPRGGKWYASTIKEILLNEEAYRGALRGDSSVAWPVILV